MKAKELKQKYIEFFESKNHKKIANASLIPEHDPTVLFTTAGMHPLVPFLMGQPHPSGKRLVNVQRCIRTGDIDEVGNSTHHTFFEMLGNWSLGDYFKKEAIEFSFEFLTKKLKIPVEKIAVTCFRGDDDAPRDNESADGWKALGIPEKRIAFLGKDDNWWGPAGQTGPCGPDTEMFVWTTKEKAPEQFDPKDKRWVEIWNDVFIQYNKDKEGKYSELKQKNVDTGMGLERTLAVLNSLDDNYLTDLFLPIIEEIEKISDKKYPENKKTMRIIADHMRSAVFILGDERGVTPGNVDQGYILRRLIRRTIRYCNSLQIPETVQVTQQLAKLIIKMYKQDYPLLEQKKEFILAELLKEEDRFKHTLDNGLKEFHKLAEKNKKLSAKQAFLLYQSFGFPIELTKELGDELNIEVDVSGFQKEFEKHQELSRKGAEQRFKGGLADNGEETTKLHTATHLLGEALRRVLNNPDIKQRGSNITPQRLRYDFSFDRKLTDDEKKQVEDLVNQKINEAIPVERTEMKFRKAKELGAQAEFEAKYEENVSVYRIGNFSLEVCGGPHVKNTKELGRFRIKKEESVAAGVRRIKAVLE